MSICLETSTGTQRWLDGRSKPEARAHHQPMVKCLKMSRRYHGTLSAAVYTQARTRLLPGSVGTVCSVRYARPCMEQCMLHWLYKLYPSGTLWGKPCKGKCMPCHRCPSPCHMREAALACNLRGAEQGLLHIRSYPGEN